jgi:hypothetical protein
MKTNFMPKTRLGKWAMWLGLGTLFVFPALGIFGAVIRPMIDNATSENTGALFGFAIGIFAMALSISALVIGIRAYRQGERSRGLWVGLIPAILVGAFWVFMIIGEFVFPH